MIYKYRDKPLPTNGLPPGIPYIIANEAAERFSFYGMRSVLLAFMTVHLVQPDGTPNCFGEKEAEAWIHLFVGSAYFFPLLGGLLADAFFGKYKTILTLSFFYCLGHGCLALMGIVGETKAWLLVGLFLIALGSGGIKPCVSSHVGDQFNQKNKVLLSKIFGWFYFSINLGAFASGMLTPFLLEARREIGTIGNSIYPYVRFLVGSKDYGEVIFGSHFAFGLPGLLMAMATFFFWLGRKDFAHIPPRGKEYFKETFSGENLKVIGRLSLIFSFVVIFWALFDQIGTLWQIQARSLNRVIPDGFPLFGGVEMLAAQVSAIWNPLFILILIPIFSYFIYPFVERFVPLSPLRKIGTGLWVMGISFIVVSLIQEQLDAGREISVFWQIFACFILTASEVMVSVTSLEFAYAQAPKSMKSMVMALYLLTVSLGNYLTSAVKFLIAREDGSSRLPGAQEFWFWTILVFLTAFVFLFAAKKYKSQDHFHE